MENNIEDQLRSIYAEVGGDYDAVLQRMMKPERIAKFLRFFSADENYALLKNSLEGGDFETAFRAAHTLKGSSREVGLMKLGDLASEVCDDLRPETGVDVESALSRMPELTQTYEKCIAAITALS